MLGVAIFTLVLAAQQVATHPPPFTMNDEVATHPPPFTMNDEEEGIPIRPDVPFENSNPSRVAAGELYQSDMLLIEEQWAALKMRKAINSESSRWTEGSDGNPLVPYIFQDSVDQDDVRAALDQWMEHTCIKFEETSNTAQPHLQFHIGSGCWSYIGMISSWDGQEISIGSGCNSLGTVVHEVGHAMGFYHEQSRSDRDDHVLIFLDNVADGKEGNFDKHADNNYGVTYDYSSNMHYGQDYFTKNGKPTIVTLDPMAQELIGSRNGLTHRDKLLANRMYDCTGKWLSICNLDAEPCLNDGYTGKDCTCICPPGTSGSTCENIVGDYYDNIRSPFSEKIVTEKSITIETPMDAGVTFVKWIVPPSCKKAKLTFTSSDMYSGDCYFQSLNVKTDSSDYEGQTLCPADVTTGVTLESDTGIIITMTNRVTYSSTKTLWAADVTFETLPGCSNTDPPTQNTTPAPVNTTPGPVNTTPAPVNTTPAPVNTTPAPIPIIPCEKKPVMQFLPTGESVIITSPEWPFPYMPKTRCGWKLKAPKGGVLGIDCESFELNGSDFLKINKVKYYGIAGPTGFTSKKFNMKFKSKRKSTGPGFICTVYSMMNN